MSELSEPELHAAVLRHIEERRQRDLEMLALLRDLIDALRLVHRARGGDDGDEVSPRPN